ncbi:MAG TPA: 2OG-Fe(II) oxygenase [Allosphingosinicella sp.]|jgi:PKHD-type hydroxylase
MALFHDRPHAFSDAECDRLIALAEESALAPAPVYGAGGYRPDPALRDVLHAYRPRSEATLWIYERLDALFAEAGAALGIAVAPMAEPLQLLRYEAGSHFQAWHGDAGYDKQRERVISVSVELSAAADHDGGDLEIMPVLLGPGNRLPRGGARFFRSQAVHRVTPVTRGRRYALVNWAPAPELGAGANRSCAPGAARDTSAPRAG